MDSNTSFPPWGIAVIVVVVVVVIVAAGAAFWFIRRHRHARSTATVDIADRTEKQIPADKPEIQQEQQQQQQQQPSKRNSHRDTLEQYSPEFAMGSPMDRTSLPPPSTSLFADKMELSSDEAMALFDKYTNAGLEASKNDGFTATIQHKAATFRSTVRQSLRRQKSNRSSTAPSPLELEQMFEQQQQYRVPQLPSAPERVDAPMVTVQQVETPTIEKEPEEEEEEVLPEGGEQNSSAAIHAARRVIRSASRKSKSRSMLVSEDDVKRMFGEEASLPAMTSGTVRRSVRHSMVANRSTQDMDDWWPPSDRAFGDAATTTPLHPPPRKSVSSSSGEKYLAPQQQADQGNVQSVRRMLQATWQANMKESGSLASILSATPQQHQRTVSPLAKQSQAAAPEPGAPFSASTVRTMIPPVFREQQQRQEQPTNLAAQEKIEIDDAHFSMSGFQTWSGRTSKKPPVVIQKQEEDMEIPVDRSSFFNTVHLGRRQFKRRVIPWMDTKSSETVEEKLTPAQRERDRYRRRSMYGA